MYKRRLSLRLALLFVLAGHTAVAIDGIELRIPSVQVAPNTVSDFTVSMTASASKPINSFTVVLRIVRGSGATSTLEFAASPTAPVTDYLFEGGSRGFVGAVPEPTLAGAFDVATPTAAPVKGAANLATFRLRASADFGGTWAIVPETVVFTALDSLATDVVTAPAGFAATTEALDADHDASVDVDDHAFVIGCFTGSGGYRLPGCEHADLDGDFAVDCRDLALFRSFVEMGNCSFGDLDRDLDIDLDDAAKFLVELQGPDIVSACSSFDADTDRDLDLVDFARFQNEYFPFPRANKFWLVDMSGAWQDPGNWSDNAIPIATDVVEINRPAGDFVVTVNQGGQTCRRIESSERLVVAGGTLTVSETIRVDNGFKLGAGKIVDATILRGHGGQGLTPPTNAAERGMLHNVTLSADCILDDAVAGNLIQLEETFTLNGVMQMSPGASQTYLAFLGTGQFSGSGELLFGADGVGVASIYGPANLVLPWTIGPALTIRGGAGRLQGFRNRGTIRAEVNGQQIQVDATGPSNEGTIEAVDGGQVQLSGNVIPRIWSNLGMIRASSGGVVSLRDIWTNQGIIIIEDATLNLGGTFSPDDVGTIVRVGETQVNLTAGTFDLAGGTFTLGSETGTWVLSAGTIKNGTLATEVGQTLLFTSAGSFDGVTLASDLTLESGQRVTMLNGLNANATFTIGGGDSAENSTLFYGNDQSLGGLGEVVFARSNTSSRNYISPESGSPTLTIGPDLLIRTGSGSGQISGPLSGSSGIIVEGEVRAETAGTSIVLEAGHTTNRGRIGAHNGATINSRPSSGAGVFTNDGDIFIGRGSIVTSAAPASFVQTASGQITIQVGGTTDADLGRMVLSAVTFSGTLNIDLVDGYAPPVGTTITPIRYASHTGTFGTITGASLDNGTIIVATYQANGLQLEVVKP